MEVASLFADSSILLSMTLNLDCINVLYQFERTKIIYSYFCKKYIFGPNEFFIISKLI